MKRFNRTCLSIALLGAATLIGTPTWAATRLSADQLDSVVAAGGAFPHKDANGNSVGPSESNNGYSSGKSASAKSSSGSHGALVSSVASANGKTHAALNALNRDLNGNAANASLRNVKLDASGNSIANNTAKNASIANGTSVANGASIADGNKVSAANGNSIGSNNSTGNINIANGNVRNIANNTSVTSRDISASAGFTRLVSVSLGSKGSCGC